MKENESIVQVKASMHTNAPVHIRGNSKQVPPGVNETYRDNNEITQAYLPRFKREISGTKLMSR